MESDAQDPLRYCRDVESYLCRRNGGHLIRIVGPAFSMVQGWARDGVPLTIVERAIDVCSERRESRREAARPLRIEFCEAEVREQFQRWRRAIGPYVGAGNGVAEGDTASGEPDGAEPPTRATSLAGHLVRAGERLARAAARLEHSDDFRERLDAVVVALDRVRHESKGARGDRRAAFADALAKLDEDLMAAAHEEAVARGVLAELRAAAARDLATWRTRMPANAWDDAVAAASGRLLRDRFDLPDLTL
jgi:hypothetical protein